MSETPTRCGTQLFYAWDGNNKMHTVVPLDFARQLERELAEAMAIFDKFDLFTKRSFDAGKTWIPYTLAERIDLACRTSLDTEDADRANAAETALSASQAENVRLRAALKGLHDDNMDYLTLNNLGGADNHWMKAARAALIAQESVATQESVRTTGEGSANTRPVVAADPAPAEGIEVDASGNPYGHFSWRELYEREHVSAIDLARRLEDAKNMLATEIVRDAARYRWARDEAAVAEMSLNEMIYLDPNKTDEAFDAAIAAAKGDRNGE